MTKRQCEIRVTKMTKNIAALIKEKAMRLFRSGGIDPLAYGADYQLPIILVTAAVSEVYNQVRPSAVKDREAIENLKKF